MKSLKSMKPGYTRMKMGLTAQVKQKRWKD